MCRRQSRSGCAEAHALENPTNPRQIVLKAIREFLRLESASGILLFAAASLAMILYNSPQAGLYDAFLRIPAEIRFGEFQIAKPLLLWVNDGLMAVFFFLVGLEIKREILEGELSNRVQIALPAFAALGGMLVPAAIYIWINRGDGVALNGWAIPAATDIAFALGVLYLLGARVPQGLKVFLLTLAILDDLGAIVVIALFYSGELARSALAVAGGALIVLAVLNFKGVISIAAYVLVGLVLWAAVLKSGVHATLAGVALALFIPLRTGLNEERAPLRQLENDLHPVVAYGILPLFAFANAGVSLQGLTLAGLTQPVPLGIAAGLFIGKQLGVFGSSWLAIRLGLATLPQGASWLALYGVAILCGIGFTMSLFIGSLAFEHADPGYGARTRLGILVGSMCSAVAGYLVLRYALRPHSRRG